LKLWMKPVEMICVNGCDGKIRPLKFKWIDEEGMPRVIKIDRILTVEEEKLAGNRMLVFAVQSCIDQEDRRFEMKYETKSMTWYLSRM